MSAPDTRPRPSPHRSRRLRKKLHVEEFQQFGFEVVFKVDETRSIADADQVFDRFVVEAIEGNALVCGGGGRYELSFFVTPAVYRNSASEADRANVVAWLEGARAAGVHGEAVGPLVDAWYS